MAVKKPYTVGYFSAYYRGLECLLDMWPDIRKRCYEQTKHYPELSIYYGWQSWLAIQGEDDLYERISGKMKDLEDQGVTEHGRVSHVELAKAMKEIQVWAYPTEFPEIHCITALKVQEAKCWPVVTTVAALNETVQSGDKIETQKIYKDDYKQGRFIEAVVSALKEKKEGTPVPGCDWSDVAKQWSDFIKEAA